MQFDDPDWEGYSSDSMDGSRCGGHFREYGILQDILEVQLFPNHQPTTLLHVEYFNQKSHKPTIGGTLVRDLELRRGDQYIHPSQLLDIPCSLNPTRDGIDLPNYAYDHVVLHFHKV